jgi:hypothetical protein
MTDPNGIIECFSQAGPPQPPSADGGINPPPPTPLDAGPAPAPVGCSGGGGGPDGALGSCGCQEQANGHTYAVNCDLSTNVCACTIDNGAPTTTFPDNGNTCSDYAALFASCGFPAP